MKGYSTFPRAPEIYLHHQIEFNVIPRTLKPSATAFQHIYDKKGLGNRVGIIIQVLGLDLTSRLIGKGPFQLASLSKSQSGVLHVMDCSTTRVPSLSITDRHPRSTGGPIRCLTTLNRCSWCILKLHPTGLNNIIRKAFKMIFNIVNYCRSFYYRNAL